MQLSRLSSSCAWVISMIASGLVALCAKPFRPADNEILGRYCERAILTLTELASLVALIARSCGCLCIARSINSVVVHRGSKIAKRSEEHTSELQSRGHLVCRLLLEK